MKYPRFSIAFLLLGVLSGSASPAPATNQPAAWREFLLPHVKSVSQKARLQPLEESIGERGFSKEARVWVLYPNERILGYVIQNKNETWIGKSIAYKPALILPLKVRSRELGASGEVLWEKLARLNILTLPDADDLAGQVRMVDAPCVIIETATKSGAYRIYHYPSPGDQTWKQARDVEAIVKRLEATLGKPAKPRDK